MSRRAHGQIRLSQVITTYGPGALIDLPRHSAIVGGLETWPKTTDLKEILEPRLTSWLQIMTGVVAPQLFTPPPDSNDPREPTQGIGAWRFPEWFIVQEASGGEQRERSRRLVHRKALDDKGRFDSRQVVATRFVRACPKGHVDDLDWRAFVHGPGIRAGGSFGSTSEEPAATWPTWLCGASAGSRHGPSTRQPSSRITRWEHARARARGSVATRTRAASSPAACSSVRPPTHISHRW